MDPISELRKKVQEPVRKYNDVAGFLVGDRTSIHVTRAFIRLGISPSVATIGFLVCGVAGSVLAAFGGIWSVAGFLLVFAYYVLDCVDGEVARYHKREKLVWGFHDFMFHLYVKSAFFTCLGVYAVTFTGRWWAFFFGLAALLATLFSKSLYDVAIVLNARYIVMRAASERDRFVVQLTEGTTAEELAVDRELPGDHATFQYGSFLSTVRTIVTNFDLSVLLFLAASIADLFVPELAIGDFHFNLKIALLVFYAVVLPLDFLDRLQTYVRTDRFHDDSRRFLRRAHHFRIRRD
jgi:hypothetical protein